MLISFDFATSLKAMEIYIELAMQIILLYCIIIDRLLYLHLKTSRSFVVFPLHLITKWVNLCTDTPS